MTEGLDILWEGARQNKRKKRGNGEKMTKRKGPMLEKRGSEQERRGPRPIAQIVEELRKRILNKKRRGTRGRKCGFMDHLPGKGNASPSRQGKKRTLIGSMIL